MPEVINAKRNYTYPVVVKLEVSECPTCGCVHGIPEALAYECRRLAGSYYCPMGHYIGWNESAETRERKKREAAEKRADQAENAARLQRERADRERAEAERIARSNAALRGHLTRIRNRIAKGICPVPGCRRSGFGKVRDHIAQKHPDWMAEHAHEIDAA